MVISGRHLNIGFLGAALASALVPAIVLTIACVRDPLPSVCPRFDAGDLVVTELRGAQAGSYRQWIEIYNASDAALPLAGLRITLYHLENDGSETFAAFFVRDEALELPAGDYLVIGGGDPAEIDYIDYDYTPDHHTTSDPNKPASLFASATIELLACDTVVDRVVYTGLPAAGTLALDGSAEPSAATNDDSATGW
ncbi:MAG: lamin tail domain-containing protein, partial [Nannocystis sp.]